MRPIESRRHDNNRREMKYLGVLLALVLCSAAMGAQPAEPTVRRVLCDRSLPLIKVWADKQRFQVNAQGRSVDMRFVYRQRPRPTQPTRRVSFWQKNIWEIKGQIVDYRLDRAAIRMVLFWDARYMNAVIPAPVCTKPQTRL